MLSSSPRRSGNWGGERDGVITARCPKEREPVTGAAPGQDLPARPSKVPILTRIPRRASPPALTLTTQISPERATLALKACALSRVSLPWGTPTLWAPQPPPSSVWFLPRMRSSPRGHTRSAFLGLRRHPEGSDGPACCPPRSYSSYPAQSGSGKSRPRRSCRTTWRRRDGRTPAASDGSEARLSTGDLGPPRENQPLSDPRRARALGGRSPRQPITSGQARHLRRARLPLPRPFPRTNPSLKLALRLPPPGGPFRGHAPAIFQQAPPTSQDLASAVPEAQPRAAGRAAEPRPPLGGGCREPGDTSAFSPSQL